MAIVYQVLLAVLWLFLLTLVARVVIELLQAFAETSVPPDSCLVLFEIVYTVTDPPLKALRRVIPPLRIGAVAFDLAILVLFIACQRAHHVGQCPGSDLPSSRRVVVERVTAVTVGSAVSLGLCRI